MSWVVVIITTIEMKIDRAAGSSNRALPREQETDPVCGMAVRTAAAKSVVYESRLYYFYSQDCREKFEAAPASYVKRAPAAAQKMERHDG